MSAFLLVGLGGVLGAVARHALAEVMPDVAGVHTLAVNVLGSLALGVLLAASVDGAATLAFGTGFCGAFTTFSTFAVELVEFAERGRHREAVSVAVANLVGALVGVLVGVLVGAAITSWVIGNF